MAVVVAITLVTDARSYIVLSAVTAAPDPAHVSRERLQDHCGPFARRLLRLGREPLEAAEHRDVAAPGQLDPHRIPAARAQVVGLEGAPQPPGLDPHDRVHGRVEVVTAAEDLRGDGGLAQGLAPAGQGT